MIFGKKSSLGNVFIDTVQCVESEKQQQKKSRSILRQLSQLSRRSIDSLSSTLSSPRTPSPRATFSDYPNPCELILLSALQGHVLSGDDMRNCASEIQMLSVLEKQKLVNFFKPDGDAAGILENNAFKAFNCSNLCTDLLSSSTEGCEILEQLWLKLNNLIVPALQSMCFPLTEFDVEFDVQSLILTAFRDRVLVKLLQDVTESLPSLKSMLLTILVETEEIPQSLKLKIDTALGKAPANNLKPRFLKKTRSKTDSLIGASKRKSVSWMDDMQESRKSSTFCT